MRVFSPGIEAFLGRLLGQTRAILRDEFDVEVARTRFRTADGTSWPIVLVAIDDASRLGYFERAGFSIGIHKSLMYPTRETVLADVLRHELAHYFTYIRYHAVGLEDRAHGAQFQATCAYFGLASDVRSASLDVNDESNDDTNRVASDAVISKWKRLMSLAESDNEHEASLAIVRANELLVKYNLDAAEAAESGAMEVEYCVKRVLEYKRSSPRASAIAQILSEFLVYPVHASGGLEVTGTRANVEHAEYVANYLDRALRAAWKRACRDSPGKRLRPKPFMAAAAASYVEKLQRAKAKLPEKDQSALVVLDTELERAGSGIYGGSLQTTTSWYRPCGESMTRGARAGRELEIRRGVTAKGVVPLVSA